MFKEVRVQNFKRFKDQRFDLNPKGLTICAGPNNHGKSTLLHALAVWAFGVSVVQRFKGKEAITEGYSGQGAGISRDDFTPINIPDLKHLWLDLKSAGPGQGYSMSITVTWDEHQDSVPAPPVPRTLTMAFSLVQDRLYIKAKDSNLSLDSRIPEVVYVPPVAGLDAREEFATVAKRRAMLGRGLAGSVLRNFLLDLCNTSKEKREAIFGPGRRKRSKAELKALEEFKKTDPWERLNELARDEFELELSVEPFEPDFHAVIRVNVQPKQRVNTTWVDAGVARDLMVEGSGAQQWLTVLTFALAPATNILLLDEPDAHLFTTLKISLFESLENISEGAEGPQILVATHAPEILKRAPYGRILNFAPKSPAFLRSETQRAQLLSGLGDPFSRLFDLAIKSGAILFVEAKNDEERLKILSEVCNMPLPKNIAILPTSLTHPDRLKTYRAFLAGIEGLKAVSLRDRDNLSLESIDEQTLRQKDVKIQDYPNFMPLTWRRREFENYALVPDAIIRLIGDKETKTWWSSQGWAWPHDPKIEKHLRDVDIKASLETLLKKQNKNITDLFRALQEPDVHQDIRIVLKRIQNL
jgi:predicted ATPase